MPTALYVAETWGAERKKLNVLEIKCLRSMIEGLECMIVFNEEIH